MDDEEPTLLMVEFCALNDVAVEPVSREELRTMEQRKQSVLLDESCSQVHLGRLGGGMEHRWYLDFVASNHMTSFRARRWTAT